LEPLTHVRKMGEDDGRDESGRFLANVCKRRADLQRQEKRLDPTKIGRDGDGKKTHVCVSQKLGNRGGGGGGGKFWWGGDDNARTKNERRGLPRPR